MGAMSPIDTRVETEVAPRDATGQRRAGRPVADASTADRSARPRSHPRLTRRRARRAIAAAIVDIVDGAIADRDALEIVLAGPGDARTRGARSRVVVKGPDAVAHLLLPPSGDAFAEAYLRGEVEIEGDVMATVVAGGVDRLRRSPRRDLRRIVRWLPELRRGRRRRPASSGRSRMRRPLHSRARDMAAIRFHYDVGEAFYRSGSMPGWPTRAPTSPGATALTAAGLLDAAQEGKLDLIARKLRLGPGRRTARHRLGWGSLHRLRRRALRRRVGRRHPQPAPGRRGQRPCRPAGVGRLVARSSPRLSRPGRPRAVRRGRFGRHVRARRRGPTCRPTSGPRSRRSSRAGCSSTTASPAPATRRRPSALRPHGNRFLQRYVFPDGELVAVEDAVALAGRPASRSSTSSRSGRITR